MWIATPSMPRWKKRDNPDLRDKPLIVGGGKRGVVSTACYLARIHGVRSAMPMFKALEACPDAVVIKPNMEKYARVGREVRQMMRDLTPLVEPISIDEAFLDLSGTERLHKSSTGRGSGARFPNVSRMKSALRLRSGFPIANIWQRLRPTLKNRVVFPVIGEAEALDFLRDKPVGTIWGVGKAFAAKLESDGIRTIGQYWQTMEEGALMKAYGTMGQRLYRLSRGQDSRKVEPDHDMKSVSAETTFSTRSFGGR